MEGRAVRDVGPALERELPRAGAMGASALALARSQFALSEVRERFVSELSRLEAA